MYKWLQEGLSKEVTATDGNCPILQLEFQHALYQLYIKLYTNLYFFQFRITNLLTNKLCYAVTTRNIKWLVRMIEENHAKVATVIFIHNTSLKKNKLLNMANILVEHFSSSSTTHVAQEQHCNCNFLVEILQ